MDDSSDGLEMQVFDALKAVSLDHAISAMQCVANWTQGGNLNYIHNCALHFHDCGIKVPYEILEIIAYASMSEVTQRPSTVKFEKNESKAKLHRIVANFERCLPAGDFTIKQASEKMALQWSHQFPEIRYPASGIERDYRRHWTKEQVLRLPNHHADVWVNVWRILPAATDSRLIGNRHS